MNYRLLLCIMFGISILWSCGDVSSSSGGSEISSGGTAGFETLPASATGITFDNEIDVEKVKSPLEYLNVYNGGGVAVGDINNDGLPDIYFGGNLSDNKLYLNKGNFQFEDITGKASVASANGWSTGVTMADVNGDGFLDIYVCRGYYDEPAKRQNLLFINNGDLTFSEKSKEYGLVDSSYSIVATFLDYDKDGHPDLFVGNHPLDQMASFEQHVKNWHNPQLEFSDRLYHNNGDGTFTDQTVQAGLLNYGWTLGTIAADLNQDGWTDIYVAVDQSEPDRYYLNNGDGTFSEVSEQKMRHISFSSMGTDAGDINNDGRLDLAIVEMLATGNFNEKTKMAPMNPKRFWSFVDAGYEFQYMRNALHLNMGDGTFSEIGQMAGTNRTDWSWSSLLADLDNDGWKDYYVTNGNLREYLDKDHQKKMLKSMEKAAAVGQSKKLLIADFGKTAPTQKVKNVFFKNNGNLTFTELGKEYGLDHPGYSSGAAYADFDNDGDLDLVVNNTNEEASVYKNMSREKTGNNYLRVKLEHLGTICPIGTKVTLESAAGLQFQEFTYTRGYQSSVEGVLHFGLGKDDLIKSLTIKWLDGKEQTLSDVKPNQVLTLRYQDAATLPVRVKNTSLLFADATASAGIGYAHQETIFDDYAIQVLLPHKMSQFGPMVSTGDVNQDGLEDFYAGGGNGHPGALFFQNENGGFTKSEFPGFQAGVICEDMGSAIFDVNNDGLPDLYVASGGNEYEEGSALYRDRLYINDGKGQLKKAKGALPDIRTSSSCVKPFDFDGDGDLDIFVGGRQVPGRYPSPANSVLLENVGGKFQDASAAKAPGFRELGMVTDAIWTDLNGDNVPDLLIAGEWMPITVFLQSGGKFVNATADFGLENTTGWWNKIATGDIDNDGGNDFILGNLGLNYKYKATPEKPFHVYAGDFDKNGTFDIALGYFLKDDVLYPVRGRQCSSEQVPSIADEFPTYNEFGKASIFEVYGDNLKTALHYEAKVFTSSVLKNMGGGKYELSALPPEAQIAPVNGIVLQDFDDDGNLDLVIGGNLYVSEVETGRADAGKGLYLQGLGNGHFKPFYPYDSGLNIPGDVKDIRPIKTHLSADKWLLVCNNNDKLQLIKWTGNSNRKLTDLQ
jgi:enediyne biosynthesis protein E4